MPLPPRVALPPRVVGRPARSRSPLGMGLGPTLTAAEQQQTDYATNAAYQALPPDVQNAIQTSNSTLQATQPAVNLIGDLANGNAVNAQEVIGALAATVSLVNPIAGGAVLIAGEIGNEFVDLFSKLFGTGNTADPTWNYVGYIRANVDPIPYPPSAGLPDDPRWMYLTANPNPNCDLANLDKLQGTTFGGCPYVPPGIPAPYAPTQASWARNYFFANAINLCFDPIYTPKRTAFEVFLAALLVKDLEYWANGNPFVPAQTLLQGAIAAWNAAHPNGAPYTVQPPTFQPTTVSSDGFSTGAMLGSPLQGTIVGTDGNVPIVSMIISPIGTFLDAPGAQALLTDALPVTIYGLHGDGAIAQTSSSSSSTAATAESVATTAISLPVAATLGALAYSLAAGQARTAGVKALFGWVRARLPL